MITDTDLLFSNYATDQEGKGSSNWAVMPTCSAVCALVTNALELSVRRTGIECGRPWWLFSGSSAASNIWFTCVCTSEPCEVSSRRQQDSSARYDNWQKQIRAAVKDACQTEQQRREGKGAKNQGRRGIQRLGRGLHDAGPGQLRCRARRFPPTQSGWPVFFALISSSSGQKDFSTFVSEEIAPAH